MEGNWVEQIMIIAQRLKFLIKLINQDSNPTGFKNEIMKTRITDEFHQAVIGEKGDTRHTKRLLRKTTWSNLYVLLFHHQFILRIL